MAISIEPLERRALLSGELDTTFGKTGFVTQDLGGAADKLTRVVVAGDGRIYAAGLTSARELTVARFTAGGTLDTTFGTADGDGVDGLTRITFGGTYGGTLGGNVALALGGDGTVYAGANYTDSDTQTVSAAVTARNPDGTVDYRFNSGFGSWIGTFQSPLGTGTLGGIAVENDAVYVTGSDGQALTASRLVPDRYGYWNFDTAYGGANDGTARVALPDAVAGSAVAFDSQVYHSPVTVGVPSQTALVLGANVTDAATNLPNAVVGELNLDGTARRNFYLTAVDGYSISDTGMTGSRLAVDNAGRVLVAGRAGDTGTVARVLAYGTQVDFSFDYDGYFYNAASGNVPIRDDVTSLVTLRDGEVVFTTQGGSGKATAGDYVYALTSQGALNANFSPERSGYVNEPRSSVGVLVTPPAGHYYGAALDAGGHVVLVGQNTPTLGGTTDAALLRLAVESAPPLTASVTGRVYVDANTDGILDGTEDATLTGSTTASIIVYDDLNNDGVRQAGEPYARAFSPGGDYTLQTQVGAGHVRVVPPAGYRASPVDGVIVTPDADRTITNVNLGLVRQGTLTVTVYNDANQNGVQDAGESLATDQQVYLDLDNSGTFDSGDRSIAGASPLTFTLDPGTYTVRWLQRGGFRQTSPAGDAAATAVVVAGNYANVGFGISDATPTTGSVVGNVFEDFDGDGRQSGPRENAFTGGGISAYLDLNADGKINTGEPKAGIDAAGHFGFAGVVPGTYAVRLNVPAGGGAAQTFPGKTGGFTATVAAGKTAAVGTFGVRLSYLVSGRVFDDADADGVFDLGETALAGRTVYADLNDNAVLDTGEPSAVTAGKGVYTLLVPSGTVRLRQVLPGINGETGRSVAVASPAGNTFAADGRVRLPDDVAGSPVPYFDFGVRPVARVFGFVVRDTNGNGVADTGESPLTSGDVVYVDANNNGALDAGEASFTTNRDGWWFDLTPGTYTLRQQLPAGFVQTSPTNNGGLTVTVTGTEANTLRPGNFLRYQPSVATASIRGIVFDNGNLNDDYDPGEAGLSGLTVFLDADGDGVPDAGEKSVVTDGDGGFAFTGLVAGTYALRAVVPAGQMPSGSPDVQSVTLAAGQAVSGLSIGLADGRVGTVVGRIYEDDNNDGVYDEGDSPVSSMDVFADLNGNGVYDATDVHADTGRSNLTYTLNLPAVGRSYRVYFDNPATLNTARSYVVTPVSGRTLTAPDFAIRTPGASVSGTVYIDANQNGKRDAGEAVLTGVTVYVDTDNDSVLDANEISTVSDAYGFRFAALPDTSSATRLRVVLPGGYGQVTPAKNYGYALNLASGGTNANKDFGLYATPAPPATNTARLAGFAFDDANKNGKYDAGETKTAGKTVFLDADNDGVLDAGEAKTTTGVDGAWSFTGLAAGAYHVRRVFPVGYTQSTALIDGMLTAGQSVTGLAIGSKSGTTPPPAGPKTASLTGYAFDDANANGRYDAGDKYTAGKTIFLDADDDGVLDPGEANVLTDGSGKFVFTGVAAGTVHVRRVFASGYTSSTARIDIALKTGQTVTGLLIGTRKA